MAKAALVQQSRFELRADHALGTVADFAVAEPMLDAIAFANGLRVAALAACNESVAAHAAADDGAKALERLTGSIGATDLVRADLAAAAEKSDQSDPAEVISRDLIVQYVAGAFMSLLTGWLDDGARLPPEQMDEVFRRLTTGAIDFEGAGRRYFAASKP